MSAGEESRSGRCGITIEAQPFSGQTCPIEPAEGLAINTGGWNRSMAPPGNRLLVIAPLSRQIE